MHQNPLDIVCEWTQITGVPWRGFSLYSPNWSVTLLLSNSSFPFCALFKAAVFMNLSDNRKHIKTLSSGLIVHSDSLYSMRLMGFFHVWFYQDTDTITYSGQLSATATKPLMVERNNWSSYYSIIFYWESLGNNRLSSFTPHSTGTSWWVCRYHGGKVKVTKASGAQLVGKCPRSNSDCVSIWDAYPWTPLGSAVASKVPMPWCYDCCNYTMKLNSHTNCSQDLMQEQLLPCL